MEVEIITTYICDKCGAKYEEDEKTAKRCENLPIEEKKFKKGDMVKIVNYHNSELIVGKISAVKLYSPIDNADLVARIRASQKSHFYLYDVKVASRGIATFTAYYLIKI